MGSKIFNTHLDLIAALTIHGSVEVTRKRGMINSGFCPLSTCRRKFINYREMLMS